MTLLHWIFSANPTKRFLTFFMLLRGSKVELSYVLKKVFIGLKTWHTDLRHSVRPNETKKLFIFLPVIDWDYRFQRPQHLASELAKQGHLVFYLCDSPTSKRGLQDFQIRRRLNENLYQVSLHHSGSLALIGKKNPVTCKEIQDSIIAAINKFSSPEASAVVFQHPTWAPCLPERKLTLAAFDYLDNYAALEISRDWGDDIAFEAIKRADRLVFSSPALKHQHSFAPEAHVIENACQFEFFDIPFEHAQKETKIVYVGAIADWFDYELILQISRIKPNWQFDLFGSTALFSGNVKKTANITLHGEIPYKELPQILSNATCGIIPFIANNVTEFVSPVKLYEYCAAGLPTVASRFGSLDQYDKRIVNVVNRSPEEWIGAVEGAIISRNNAEDFKFRKSFAAKNSWAARALDFEEALFPEMGGR